MIDCCNNTHQGAPQANKRALASDLVTCEIYSMQLQNALYFRDKWRATAAVQMLLAMISVLLLHGDIVFLYDAV